jgi:hypothetical protein
MPPWTETHGDLSREVPLHVLLPPELRESCGRRLVIKIDCILASAREGIAITSL